MEEFALTPEQESQLEKLLAHMEKSGYSSSEMATVRDNFMAEAETEFESNRVKEEEAKQELETETPASEEAAITVPYEQGTHPEGKEETVGQDPIDINEDVSQKFSAGKFTEAERPAFEAWKNNDPEWQNKLPKFEELQETINEVSGFNEIVNNKNNIIKNSEFDVQEFDSLSNMDDAEPSLKYVQQNLNEGLQNSLNNDPVFSRERKSIKDALEKEANKKQEELTKKVQSGEMSIEEANKAYSTWYGKRFDELSSENPIYKRKMDRYIAAYNDLSNKYASTIAGKQHEKTVAKNQAERAENAPGIIKWVYKTPWLSDLTFGMEVGWRNIQKSQNQTEIATLGKQVVGLNKVLEGNTGQVFMAFDKDGNPLGPSNSLSPEDKELVSENRPMSIEEATPFIKQRLKDIKMSVGKLMLENADHEKFRDDFSKSIRYLNDDGSINWNKVKNIDDFTFMAGEQGMNMAMSILPGGGMVLETGNLFEEVVNEKAKQHFGEEFTGSPEQLLWAIEKGNIDFQGIFDEGGKAGLVDTAMSVFFVGNVTKLLKNATKGGLKFAEFMARTAIGAGAEGATEIIQSNITQTELKRQTGKPVDYLQMKEEGFQAALLTGVIPFIGGGFKITGQTYSKAKKAYANAMKGAIDWDNIMTIKEQAFKDVNDAVENGDISQKQAQDIVDDVNLTSEAIEKTPPNFKGEKKEKAVNTLKKKLKAEQQLKNTDKALGAGIQLRIEAFDKELEDISRMPNGEDTKQTADEYLGTNLDDVIDESETKQKQKDEATAKKLGKLKFNEMVQEGKPVFEARTESIKEAAKSSKEIQGESLAKTYAPSYKISKLISNGEIYKGTEGKNNKESGRVRLNEEEITGIKTGEQAIQAYQKIKLPLQAIAHVSRDEGLTTENDFRNEKDPVIKGVLGAKINFISNNNSDLETLSNINPKQTNAAKELIGEDLFDKLLKEGGTAKDLYNYSLSAAYELGYNNNQLKGKSDLETQKELDKIYPKGKELWFRGAKKSYNFESGKFEAPSTQNTDDTTSWTPDAAVAIHDFSGPGGTVFFGYGDPGKTSNLEVGRGETERIAPSDVGTVLGSMSYEEAKKLVGRKLEGRKLELQLLNELGIPLKDAEAELLNDINNETERTTDEQSSTSTKQNRGAKKGTKAKKSDYIGKKRANKADLDKYVEKKRTELKDFADGRNEKVQNLSETQSKAAKDANDKVFKDNYSENSTVVKDTKSLEKALTDKLSEEDIQDLKDAGLEFDSLKELSENLVASVGDGAFNLELNDGSMIIFNSGKNAGALAHEAGHPIFRGLPDKYKSKFKKLLEKAIADKDAVALNQENRVLDYIEDGKLDERSDAWYEESFAGLLGDETVIPEGTAVGLDKAENLNDFMASVAELYNNGDQMIKDAITNGVAQEPSNPGMTYIDPANEQQSLFRKADALQDEHPEKAQYSRVFAEERLKQLENAQESIEDLQRRKEEGEFGNETYTPKKQQQKEKEAPKKSKKQPLTLEINEMFEQSPEMQSLLDNFNRIKVFKGGRTFLKNARQRKTMLFLDDLEGEKKDDRTKRGLVALAKSVVEAVDTQIKRGRKGAVKVYSRIGEQHLKGKEFNAWAKNEAEQNLKAYPAKEAKYNKEIQKLEKELEKLRAKIKNNVDVSKKDIDSKRAALEEKKKQKDEALALTKIRAVKSKARSEFGAMVYNMFSPQFLTLVDGPKDKKNKRPIREVEIIDEVGFNKVGEIVSSVEIDTGFRAPQFVKINEEGQIVDDNFEEINSTEQTVWPGMAIYKAMTPKLASILNKATDFWKAFNKSRKKYLKVNQDVANSFNNQRKNAQSKRNKIDKILRSAVHNERNLTEDEKAEIKRLQEGISKTFNPEAFVELIHIPKNADAYTVSSISQMNYEQRISSAADVGSSIQRQINMGLSRGDNVFRQEKFVAKNLREHIYDPLNVQTGLTSRAILDSAISKKAIKGFKNLIIAMVDAFAPDVNLETKQAQFEWGMTQIEKWNEIFSNPESDLRWEEAKDAEMFYAGGLVLNKVLTGDTAIGDFEYNLIGYSDITNAGSSSFAANNKVEHEARYSNSTLTDEKYDLYPIAFNKVLEDNEGKIESYKDDYNTVDKRLRVLQGKIDAIKNNRRKYYTSQYEKAKIKAKKERGEKAYVTSDDVEIDLRIIDRITDSLQTAYDAKASYKASPQYKSKIDGARIYFMNELKNAISAKDWRKIGKLLVMTKDYNAAAHASAQRLNSNPILIENNSNYEFARGIVDNTFDAVNELMPTQKAANDALVKMAATIMSRNQELFNEGKEHLMKPVNLVNPLNGAVISLLPRKSITVEGSTIFYGLEAKGLKPGESYKFRIHADEGKVDVNKAKSMIASIFAHMNDSAIVWDGYLVDDNSVANVHDAHGGNIVDMDDIELRARISQSNIADYGGKRDLLKKILDYNVENSHLTKEQANQIYSDFEAVKKESMELYNQTEDYNTNKSIANQFWDGTGTGGIDTMKNVKKPTDQQKITKARVNFKKQSESNKDSKQLQELNEIVPTVQEAFTQGKSLFFAIAETLADYKTKNPDSLLELDFVLDKYSLQDPEWAKEIDEVRKSSVGVKAKAKLEMINLVHKDKVKARKRVNLAKIITDLNQEIFAQFNQNIQTLLGTESKSLALLDRTGMGDLEIESVKINNEIGDLILDYNTRYSKQKMQRGKGNLLQDAFFQPTNTLQRLVYGIVNMIPTDVDNYSEALQAAKDEIQKAISHATESDRSYEQQSSKEFQQEWDRIKDINNVEELIELIDPINKQAIDEKIEWNRKNRPAAAQVSKELYGKDIEMNDNYIGISWIRRGATDLEDTFIGDGVLSKTGKVVKSGSYDVRPNGLNKDMVINLDMDNAMFNDMQKTLTMAKAAPLYEQVKAAIKTSEFKEVFGGDKNASTVSLAKVKFLEYADWIMGKSIYEKNSRAIKQVRSILSKVGTIAYKKLGGPTALGKQFSIAAGLPFKALIDINPMDFFRVWNDKSMVSKYLKDNGFEVSRRTLQAQAALDAVQNRLGQKYDFKTIGGIVDIGLTPFYKLASWWLKSVAAGDTPAARLFAITMYRQDMRRQGKKVDLTKPANKQAVRYANHVTPLNHNTSIAEKSGDFWKGKNIWTLVAKNAWGLFKNHTAMLKNTVWSSARIMSSILTGRSTSTHKARDFKAAAQDLLHGIAAQYAFNSVAEFIAIDLVARGAMYTLAAIKGDDTDDEKWKKRTEKLLADKRKRYKMYMRGGWITMFNPMPIWEEKFISPQLVNDIAENYFGWKDDANKENWLILDPYLKPGTTEEVNFVWEAKDGKPAKQQNTLDLLVEQFNGPEGRRFYDVLFNDKIMYYDKYRGEEINLLDKVSPETRKQIKDMVASHLVSNAVAPDEASRIFKQVTDMLVSEAFGVKKNKPRGGRRSTGRKDSKRK